jgi:hypothetical protein
MAMNFDDAFTKNYLDTMYPEAPVEPEQPATLLASGGPVRSDVGQVTVQGYNPRQDTAGGAFVGTRLSTPKAGQAQPTQQDREKMAIGLLDTLAGALRGAAAQTIGLPGDIRSILDLINKEGADKYLGQAVLPTTEEMLAGTALPPVLKEGVPNREERQKAVDVAQEVGTFLPAPGAPEAVIQGGKLVGKAIKATKNMPVGMSTQIVSAEEANKLIEKTLPVDKVQRSKNYKAWAGNADIKDEAGKPRVLYHGTTHDFDTFTLERANPENYFGEGFYFTDKVEDANRNYAAVGPDLKSRIERKGEEIEQLFEGADENEIKARAFNAGINYDNYLKTENVNSWDELDYREKSYIGYEIAKKEMMTNQGVVMPIFAKMNNPVKLGTKDETRYVLDTKFDDETGDFIEESGNGIDLINAFKQTADEWGIGDEVDDAYSALVDAFADGEVTAGKVDQILRDKLTDLYDIDGNYTGPGKFIANMFKNMGHDGIVMNAEEYFGPDLMRKGMEGVKNANHYIVFEPTQIKSAIGNRGTFDSKDPSIVKGVAIGGGGAGAAATQEENK